MSTDQPPPLATPLEGAYTIPVDLRVVLGSARLTVADILKLGRGAIIELDRRVAEPVSVYAGEQLIARGEIVVVEDRLGVSLTEIAKAP